MSSNPQNHLCVYTVVHRGVLTQSYTDRSVCMSVIADYNTRGFYMHGSDTAALVQDHKVPNVCAFSKERAGYN